uniref:Uncharacterized protein n=1 Tax=Plectus sambesii TaxID=2011161 RepID=A0A914UMF7_9BILA
MYIEWNRDLRRALAALCEQTVRFLWSGGVGDGGLAAGTRRAELVMSRAGELDELEVAHRPKLLFHLEISSKRFFAGHPVNLMLGDGQIASAKAPFRAFWSAFVVRGQELVAAGLGICEDL